MPLELNNFSGAEFDGLQELSGMAGATTIEDTVVRSGNHSYLLPGGAVVTRIVMDIAIGTGTNQGNRHICGFAVQCNDTTPTTISAIWSDDNAAADINFNIALQLATNGDINLIDSNDTVIATVTAPLRDNRWYFIEVIWEFSSSGIAQVFIDRNRVINVSGQDFDRAGNAPTGYIWLGRGTVGEETYIDDIYIKSGATDANDLLGNAEVFLYRDPSAGATENGDTLTGGTTWGDAQEKPVNDTNFAEYNSSSALSGSVDTDDATDGGASGDNRVQGALNIQGAKYYWRIRRGTGSGTTHSILFGNDGDGTTSETVTLSTSFEDFFRVSELDTVKPTDTEFMRIGMAKSSGGRQIDCAECYPQILHVPVFRRRIHIF